MYRRKLVAFALASAFVVLASAIGIVWASRVTLNQITQVNVANSLLAEHLELSSTSYRLFKQLTDEILLGNQANQAKVRNKRALISESLGRIRVLEVQQRESLGAESTRGSVEDTDDLEAQIDDIIAGFESVILASPSLEERSRQVRFILEERIDIGFREAINTAVDRQSNVVSALNGRINNIHQMMFWTSLALALSVVILTLLSVARLVRALAMPVDSLVQGAEAIAHGDLMHRVPRGYDVEFDRIAAAFNHMAEDLAARNVDREEARKELEYVVAQRTAELTDANAALKKSDVVRRNFLADVSHELRTPLTIIRGEAQVALRREDRDTTEYRDALRCVLEQSVSLAHLVDDLLFVARADANSLRIDRQALDVGRMLDDMERDLSKLAEEKSIGITVNASSGDSIVADPERLRQLIVILVENAIRYSPQETVITIGSERLNGTHRITVTDRGHGIDSQDLPFVFERFYRGSRAGDRGGMGLGLAVARAIVQAHGGDIVAQSEVGKGTTMVVTLPVDVGA